ncbi:MAG: hypothetical protein JW784_01380 [Candidatus Cloacimonetes bacterium]|nr:hypothetical protein [Candidatus Cloacimonadota bacterium]
MKKRIKPLPWYSISLLITLLGAISIVLFFGIYSWGWSAFIFWVIIACWAVILIGATYEISRQEFYYRQLIREMKDKINQLEKELLTGKHSQT